jgi:hypothetical protein
MLAIVQYNGGPEESKPLPVRVLPLGWDLIPGIDSRWP